MARKVQQTPSLWHTDFQCYARRTLAAKTGSLFTPLHAKEKRVFGGVVNQLVLLVARPEKKKGTTMRVGLTQNVTQACLNVHLLLSAGGTLMR